MKVILRADVENLGTLGDIVDVRPGYGRNYLLPQGMAMLASPANLKAFELERKKLEVRMDALRGEARTLSAKLESADVIIAMRVGENDKLYGSVTTSMIADVLAEQGLELDRRRILLDSPIRVLGAYPLRVRLHADVVANLTVTVVAEERIIHDDAPVQKTAVAEEAVAQEARVDDEASAE